MPERQRKAVRTASQRLSNRLAEGEQTLPRPRSTVPDFQKISSVVRWKSNPVLKLLLLDGILRNRRIRQKMMRTRACPCPMAVNSLLKPDTV